MAKLRLYADDTTLYLSHPNQYALESRPQSKFDELQSWFKRIYPSINESKTKVSPLGDNPSCFELFADRTRPPLEVVHNMKLLVGLTVIDSRPYLLKHTLNLYVIRLMSKLVPLGEFVNSYLQK